MALVCYLIILVLLTACDDAPVPTPPQLTPTPPVATPRRATPAPKVTVVPREPPPVPPSRTPSQAALESAYVLQVTLIVSSVLSAPAMGDAVTAAGDAGTTALFGGTVNGTALTDTLTKAAAVVAAAGEKMAALTPPPAYQPTHQQLLRVFEQYNTAFTQAQTAAQNSDWLALATAGGQIAATTEELTTLLNQLK